MLTVPGRTHDTRGGGTRETILAVAERLFAEHGVYAVSNRHISLAAGQGNNAAVGYHFGTKSDLVRAIVGRHAKPIDDRRDAMLAEIGDTCEIRDWVACLVRPGVDHLASLGCPTWYGRFAAQVMTDPRLREIVIDETFGPSVQHTVDGLNRCLPDLPLPVRMQRSSMARLLLTHSLAERERELAEDSHASGSSWDEYATWLTDALVGLWLAPHTPGS
ncbi:TetR/AcrR family transcriptional regulator [Streptomyces xiaopingdaonensis]|uniref:TetR/AcrR family transcriptional regulator n=1 Tax=Streptomyces xiaopingdaonensis TaxID=1565415 RepID=UPI000368F9C7|nr:TetR/AcrR family transcriptional regulator [Streptomyces xiaopingdaonensis]